MSERPGVQRSSTRMGPTRVFPNLSHPRPIFVGRNGAHTTGVLCTPQAPTILMRIAGMTNVKGTDTLRFDYSRPPFLIPENCCCARITLHPSQVGVSRPCGILFIYDNFFFGFPTQCFRYFCCLYFSHLVYAMASFISIIVDGLSMLRSSARFRSSLPICDSVSRANLCSECFSQLLLFFRLCYSISSTMCVVFLFSENAVSDYASAGGGYVNNGRFDNTKVRYMRNELDEHGRSEVSSCYD